MKPLSLAWSMRVWLMCLALPMAVWAQGPTTPKPLDAEPLLQECRTRQQNGPWADCACYTRKVLELRAARPGGNDTLFQTEAWYACPDPAAIQATENRKCMDQRRLVVPSGIDAAAWCQCRADEITRLTMAFAPAKHLEHTQASFWNSADAHCKRTVKAPSNTLAGGMDLSGPWRFQHGILDLHFDAEPGKWSQAPHEAGGEVRHFRHGVTVVGFSENVAAATARMHQHPRTQTLDLQFDVTTPIPYLSARRCLASDVSPAVITGRCMDTALNDIGPFTLRRPDPGETITTLNPTTAAGEPAATGTSLPPVAAPSPTPGPSGAPMPSTPSAGCTGGRTACYAGCAKILTRPSLDMMQRLTQCRQSCKSSCGS